MRGEFRGVIDCFEILKLPRGLLLDETALKDAWHHSVAMAEKPEELHRAYAILRETAKRIEHLLTLQGKKTAGTEKPGAKLFDLFFTIGAALKKADEVSLLIGEATTALQRAGLTNQLLRSLDELTLANQSIAEEKAIRLRQLKLLSTSFPELSDSEWETLATLGNDFAFLTKWESEISKRETRLQETLMGKIV